MPLRPYFATPVLSLPENGALVIPIELDFTVTPDGGSPVFDLMADLMSVGGVSFIQGIFVDQGANFDPLTLTFSNSSNQGFVLRLAGKIQTWQPLLLPVGAVSFTASSPVVALKKVQLHLFNFPVIPAMWNAP